jgi:hypothetical protein
LTPDDAERGRVLNECCLCVFLLLRCVVLVSMLFARLPLLSLAAAARGLLFAPAAVLSRLSSAAAPSADGVPWTAISAAPFG